MSDILMNTPGARESLFGQEPDEATYWLTPETADDPHVQARIAQLLKTSEGRAHLEQVKEAWSGRGLTAPWETATDVDEIPVLDEVERGNRVP